MLYLGNTPTIIVADGQYIKVIELGVRMGTVRTRR